MIFKISCLLLVAALLGSATSAPSSPKKRTLPPLRRLHQLPPPPAAMKGAKAPITSYFEQEMDHFNPFDTRRWQQKYFSNDQYYTDGGPVFIMIGGEGPGSAGWVQGGQMMELAQTWGAMAYFLEHRYYGDSKPTPDTSVDSLQHLSAEQALADLALFILIVREDYPMGKLFVFGGSYAGNLAAWARLKYAHLIDAAIASSAPVLAKVDFQEYYEVVAKAMGDSNDLCLANVREASDTVTAILASPGGAENITSMFSLCSPLDITKRNDVYNFYSAFAEIYAGTVQYATNLAEVAEWCDLMVDPGYGVTPLARYQFLADQYLSEDGCFDVSYESYGDFYGDTDWDMSASSSGYRQWIYQTCTEYGYYQTSNAANQPFGDFFQVEYYLDFCKDFYDSKFTPDFVYTAAYRTNMMFGGLNPQLTNVAFIHGSIDPWHTLGILESPNPEVPVIMIEGSAHCADMSTSSVNDSDELKVARQLVAWYVNRWMSG